MADRKRAYALAAREHLLAIADQLTETFVAREDAVRCMLLAHLCEEHYLFVGDPGTGKTALAKAFSRHITGARFFGTMLGSFSSPEKVFGPLDIAAFQKGEYKTVTGGKLPDCEFSFLDEYFKCNEGALNEMLTALNEREFEGRRIPLMTAGTATNWPELDRRSEVTDALYDRILLRCVVEDVSKEDDTVALLEAVDSVEKYEPRVTITLEQLKAVIEDVRQVEISDAMRKLLHSVRARLVTREVAGEVKPGIQISGRRVGKLQAALRAQAWLSGRDEVTLEDFDVLRWGLWVERNDIEQVEAVLGSIDAEAVKRVIRRIDEARTTYNRIEGTQAGAATLNEVMENIKFAARMTREELEQPIFTANGRRMIADSMQQLKRCFKAMEARVGKAGEAGGER